MPLNIIKKKMFGKTAHELGEEGDLKLAANDKKILKYMRASLENCERMRQGFFFIGMKMSLSVSLFLDPFLLQESNGP